MTWMCFEFIRCACLCRIITTIEYRRTGRLRSTQCENTSTTMLTGIGASSMDRIWSFRSSGNSIIWQSISIPQSPKAPTHKVEESTKEKTTTTMEPPYGILFTFFTKTVMRTNVGCKCCERNSLQCFYSWRRTNNFSHSFIPRSNSAILWIQEIMFRSVQTNKSRGGIAQQKHQTTLDNSLSIFLSLCLSLRCTTGKKYKAVEKKTDD